VFVHTSIADIREEHFIEQLLGSDPYWRLNLFNILGIDRDPTPLLQVPLTGLEQGDIDILLVAQDRPQTATAIQVKRIKVSPRALQTGRPNRLRDLKEGKEQANRLAQLGFWQVYLYVFVIVDSRELNAEEIATGKISYRGMGQPLRSVVEQAMSPEGLNERVGFVHCEFTQAMEHPITVDTSGLHLIRLAQPNEQLPNVTEWVAGAYAARGQK